MRETGNTIREVGMARLYEYQGKEILYKAKVAIPRGEVASTAQDAARIAQQIGKPVVIKAQIWAGGRGKAGGIQFAENSLDAETI
jgi:succinyl-CoA synthetase beta subunit